MPAGNLIAMPIIPVAPISIEAALNDTVGVSTGTFDPRQQQFYVWNVGPCEISATFPPMKQSQFDPAWINFLAALQGTANYFQFSPALTGQYADILQNAGVARYWRLKANQRRWTVDRDRYYRLTLDCREAF